MLTARRLALLALLTTFLTPAWAQEVQTVSGTVTHFPFGEGTQTEWDLDSVRVEVTAPYVAFDSTDADGRFELSGTIPTTAAETAPTPSAFAITDAYPNPFGDALRVCTTLPASGTLETTLTDVAGRRVLHEAEEHPQGRHCATIDGTGLAAGTYLVTQRFGDEVVTRRVTHLPSAPGVAGGDAAGEPSPEASARSGGCYDVDLVVTRTGFDPFETTTCLPLEATFDIVLDYALHTHEFVVTAASGGPLAGASVGIDWHSDGEVDTTQTTDANGRAEFALENYGRMMLNVVNSGYESVIQAPLFFTDGTTEVELENIPFRTTVVVKDTEGEPIGGAAVAATCDVNGTPFEAEGVTMFEGWITLFFDFDDLAPAGVRRGGEDYVLDCDVEVERASYLPLSFNAELEHFGTTEVALDSHTLHEVHVRNLLDHYEDLSGESLALAGGTAWNEDREPATEIPVVDGVARFYAPPSFTLNVAGADWMSTKVWWNLPLGEIDQGESRGGAEYFGEDMAVEAVENVNGTSTASLYAAPTVGADGNWPNGGNPYLFIKHKTGTDPRDGDEWMGVPIGNADMLYEGEWVIAPFEGFTEQTAPPSALYMDYAEEASHIITEQFEEKMFLDFTVVQRSLEEYSLDLLAVTQGPTSCQGVNYKRINPDGHIDRFGVVMSDTQCATLGNFVGEMSEHMLPIDFGINYAIGTSDGPRLIEFIADYMRIGIMLGNMAEAGNP